MIDGHIGQIIVLEQFPLRAKTIPKLLVLKQHQHESALRVNKYVSDSALQVNEYVSDSALRVNEYVSDSMDGFKNLMPSFDLSQMIDHTMRAMGIKPPRPAELADSAHNVEIELV